MWAEGGVNELKKLRSNFDLSCIGDYIRGSGIRGNKCPYQPPHGVGGGNVEKATAGETLGSVAAGKEITQ
jgi:hypothetical protein